MGFWFRKSVKILPGVRLNFSRSGVSTTIGVRGASVNLGRRGTFLNTGIPGTGIWRRDRIEGAHDGPPPLRARGASTGAATVAGLVLLIVAAANCGREPESAAYSTPPLSAAALDHAGDANATPPAERTETFYAHSALNVREEPHAKARVVRTLARGDAMQLGPADGTGWAALYTGGTIDGYVYRASNAVRRSAPPTRTNDAPQGLMSTRRRPSAESREYHRGPRGGCYTRTASGGKRYVDRSYCD